MEAVMKSSSLRTVSISLLVTLSVALPVAAHHGWDGNANDEFELTGVVDTPLSLSGPHATMKINVEGQIWDVTLAPPARTERAGLKVGVIPKGAQVKVQGHRNSDPKRFEVKTERVTYNGKLFNVYPDRT
jgi:hypothetical protein